MSLIRSHDEFFDFFMIVVAKPCAMWQQPLKQFALVYFTVYCTFPSVMSVSPGNAHQYFQSKAAWKLFYPHSHILPSAIALMAWRSLISSSKVCLSAWGMSFGYIPSTHIPLKGNLMIKISEKHFLTSIQMFWIFVHSHKQSNRVPFFSKHWEQTYTWTMTGIIYILINHLYHNPCIYSLFLCH